MPKYIDSEGVEHYFSSTTSKYDKKEETFVDYDQHGNKIANKDGSLMIRVKTSEGYCTNFSKTSLMSDTQKKDFLQSRADKNFKESGFEANKNQMIKNLKI